MFKETSKSSIIEKKGEESESLKVNQVSFDNNSNSQENKDFQQLKAEKIEESLNEAGFVVKTDDGVELDINGLKNLKAHEFQNKIRFTYNNTLQRINRSDIFKFLNDQSGFLKNDPDKNVKPFFSLPASLEDAQKGVMQDGHCLPWDAFSHSYFRGDVKLPSGESLSLPDMFYLKKMKELDFHRDDSGNLVYRDDKSGKLEKFTAQRADKIFGRSVSFKEDGGDPVSLANCPDIFIKQHLPFIDSLKVFREGDFRRMSTTKSFDRFLSHDRKFNANGPSFYNSAVNEIGIRYYLGRNKLVGTDKEINDNMFLRDLSTDTVGVIQEEHERKKILYTFNKMSGAELDDREDFQTNKQPLSVNSEEMAKRIKKYKITNFLPRRKNESPEDYANRLSDLSDVDFVTDKFRNLISKSDVPLSAFSWPEQLMIANYSLSGNKAEKLIEFANRYGVDGLKAFLVVEQDVSAGQTIIDIGDKIDIEKAKSIFSKVSELGVVANQDKGVLSSVVLNNQDEFLAEGVHSKLIDLAAKALDQFQGEINKQAKSSENIDNLIFRLQAIKIDNALLISVLQSAKESGQPVSLEMIKNLDLEKKIINSQEESLSQEEKNELLRIAQENYSTIFLQTGPNYNPEAYKRVIDDFAKELNDLEGQTVYILKYKDEIIGFNRFKPLSSYEVYAGSLNVSKDIQGLSIGKSFLAKTLDDVSASYDIHAQTRQDNPANNSYLRQGFIITGEYQESDGVAYYNLIKPSRASSEKVA